MNGIIAAQALVIGLLAAGPEATAVKLEVVRPEFAVNELVTLGNQDHATTAMEQGGSFAVTWHTRSDDGLEVLLRRFDRVGLPTEDEFEVSDPSLAGYQILPDVATGGLERFVVVWNSQRPDPQSGFNLMARVYTLEGEGGDEILVNDAVGPSDRHIWPDVSMFPNGDFIVIWDHSDLDAGIRVHYARLFNAAGLPLGDAVRVDETPSPLGAGARRNQRLPDVATPAPAELPYGDPPVGSESGLPDIAVAEVGPWKLAFACWKRLEDNGLGLLVSVVSCRRFSLHTLQFEDEFLVDPQPPPLTVWQGRPTVDLNSDGDLLVAWQEQDLLSASNPLNVWVRSYDGQSRAWAEPFAAPGNADFDQHRAVARFVDGDRYVLAWTRDTDSEEGTEVLAMVIDPAGSNRSRVVTVPDRTLGDQRRPALGVHIDESETRIVVIWESLDQDGSGWGIFGKLYSLRP